jgi:uncharacterized protein
MKIPKARVAHIASQMLRALTEHKDIETESPAEVQRDIEAVLNQYIRDEQELSEKARDMMAQRGLPSGQLSRIRSQLAEQRKIKLGDEAIDYVVDQLIECLMQSNNVEEIYAADHQLRRLLREPLRELDSQEDSIQSEVRAQMKHVQEGTAKWEVEYQRILEDVRRRKGL